MPAFVCFCGDSSTVQGQLKDMGAFAAILGDGSVVTWGDADDGGDSSAVQHQLKGVQHIQASASAFAAILGDGSVVAWGQPDYGGDSSAVQHQLKDRVQASAGAFAATLGDESAMFWGHGRPRALLPLFEDEASRSGRILLGG